MISEGIEIKELTCYSKPLLEEVGQLMKELSETVPPDVDNFTRVVEDSNCHLYVILKDSHIIGCATLCIFHSPTGTKASIEDVVVSSAYRGQHLGRRLMEHLMGQAQEYAPIQLQLTSRPSRIQANNLYKSLGFQQKETNCYTLMLTNDVEEEKEKRIVGSIRLTGR